MQHKTLSVVKELALIVSCQTTRLETVKPNFCVICLQKTLHERYTVTLVPNRRKVFSHPTEFITFHSGRSLVSPSPLSLTCHLTDRTGKMISWQESCHHFLVHWMQLCAPVALCCSFVVQFQKAAKTSSTHPSSCRWHINQFIFTTSPLMLAWLNYALIKTHWGQ